VHWWASPGTEPFDPLFGLPLWFQARCSGATLWAHNRYHLGYLREYVAADLRHRPPNTRSMAARLPKWIKAASNREEIVACLDRMAAL